MNRAHTVWFLLGAVASLCGCASAEPRPVQPVEPAAAYGVEKPRATRAETPAIDPAADALLKRMSEYLGNLRAFSYEADHTTEVVRKSGQKLQFAARSRVSVRRPDKLRSDRRGEIVDASLLYNGKTITVYGKRMNLYAQAPAPNTVDAAIDFARDRLDLDAPGADLLYSRPYDALMEDVVSGMRVGPAFIDETPCQHLAYRGNVVDWQIWIQDGSTPLPLKYVITTKDVKGEPQFSVVLREWNTSPELPDELFEFTPPAGAQRIEFLGLLEERGTQSAH